MQLAKQERAQRRDDQTIDLTVRDLSFPDFRVYGEVLNPQIMGSLPFAEYVADNSDVYEGVNVADVGTGTGIQALVAAARGAGRVYASDVDPQAVANARENVEQFGFAEQIELSWGDLLEMVRDDAAVIIANLPFYDGLKRPDGFVSMGGDGMQKSSPEDLLVHRLFRQVQDRPSVTTLLMPFYHGAPAWNDPGHVARDFGFTVRERVTKLTEKNYPGLLQVGDMSFYTITKP